MHSRSPKELAAAHVSKVYAEQSEWDLIAEVGLDRGIFEEVEESEIFHANGRPILAGAMGVEKEKEIDGRIQHCLRFITILTPLNQLTKDIPGDAGLLPFVAHAVLLILGPEECALVDSEDFTSCFNLMLMPRAWRGFMAFERKVSGSVKGPGESDFRIAIRTVPMGWRGAVDLVQHCVRHIVFELAEIDPLSEIRKGADFPPGPMYSIVYLDSFDHIRVLARNLALRAEDTESAEHKRFKTVCAELGLPFNVAKSLVGNFKGTLQGGEFDGWQGFFGHKRSRSHRLVYLTLGLILQEFVSTPAARHWAGLACFAASYRRPLFSCLGVIFQRIEAEEMLQVDGPFVEELLSLVGLLPLAVTNLRAQLHNHISCSDASPSGGGAAIASEFSKLEPIGPGRAPEQNQYLCPAKCGYVGVSMEAVIAHRDRGCPGPPKGALGAFAEVSVGTVTALQGRGCPDPPKGAWERAQKVTCRGRQCLHRR